MIFSRGRSRRDPVVEFWTWWPSARPQVLDAISSGEWEAVTAEMTRRVHAIHKDLVWEFSAGAGAEHALVVSPGGAAALRALTARWGSLAPPADDTFEFHTSRRPEPATLNATIDFDGRKVDLSQLRFAYTPDEFSVHVIGHHPLFHRMPETVRGQITFLALDWLLGEDTVEIWIGEVGFSADEPPGATAPSELAAAVEGLRARFAEPAWAMLQGTAASGGPVLVTVQRPLRPARWPLFATHVAVRLPFTDLQALRDFEDGPLTEALGTPAAGVLVAHETADGTRTMHYYVDEATGASRALAAAVTAWPGGSAEATHDPSFAAVRHLS